MANDLITSAGENLIHPSTWQLKLQIATVADSENRKTPLALSDVEFLLDALTTARFNKLKEVTDWVVRAADLRDKYTDEELRGYLKDDFVRAVNEVDKLSLLIEDIATSLAADLREAGNAILLQKEVSRA